MLFYIKYSGFSKKKKKLRDTPPPKKKNKKKTEKRHTDGLIIGVIKINIKIILLICTTQFSQFHQRIKISVLKTLKPWKV